MDKITWSAYEYEDKERSNDWFWALGIIVATGAIAAIIYGNYFFATLILLSGSLLGYMATKKAELINYELNHKGFVMHDSLFPYENIKAFWVQKETFSLKDEEKLKPLLFIKSERFFMPIIIAPIENSRAEEIRSFLIEKNIVEEEMKEHISMKIMEALGF